MVSSYHLGRGSSSCTRWRPSWAQRCCHFRSRACGSHRKVACRIRVALAMPLTLLPHTKKARPLEGRAVRRPAVPPCLPRPPRHRGHLAGCNGATVGGYWVHPRRSGASSRSPATTPLHCVWSICAWEGSSTPDRVSSTRARPGPTPYGVGLRRRFGPSEWGCTLRRQGEPCTLPTGRRAASPAGRALHAQLAVSCCGDGSELL